jgi:hypothetical protein
VPRAVVERRLGAALGCVGTLTASSRMRVGMNDCSGRKGVEAAFTTWASMRLRIDA